MLQHPWDNYSRKLAQRLETLRYAGKFSEPAPVGMRLVQGVEGSVDEGEILCLSWIVDENDGVIADARFQAFGSSALLAAADVACELLMRKNYDQARRITAELIDKQLHDQPDRQAFPAAVVSVLNRVLSAIDQAAAQCGDIPFAEAYTTPPMPWEQQTAQLYPGWDALTESEQIRVIEEVVAADIRPYIELDAGGVQVMHVQKGREIEIVYEGSCTTCYSATGSTLTAIQQILRTRIHPELVVTPKI